MVEVLYPVVDGDVKLIREKVEHLDYSIFKNLEKNDILFIDSSHVVKVNSDVLYEFRDVLPILKSGVRVHFHDIFSLFINISTMYTGPLSFEIATSLLATPSKRSPWSQWSGDY